jgi:hypothetical protein
MASQTVLQAIERFKDNRTRFIDFCRSLSEEELNRDVPESTYRVKDFISHLGTLDTVLTEQVEQLVAGNSADLGQGDDGTPFDVDKWNDAEVAKRRDWPLDKILDEASRNREAFLAAVARLEDQHIDQTLHFNGDNKRDPADIPFRVFLQGLTRHDPIHVADMVKALPERADDPTVKEWTNDTVVQWYQNAMAGPPRR